MKEPEGFKGTQGEWAVQFNGLSGYGDNGNTFNVVAESGTVACLPSSFRLLDTNSRESEAFKREEADAAILRASKDLLAALQVAERELVADRNALHDGATNAYGIYDDERDMAEVQRLDAIVTQVRAAISKALTPKEGQ